MSADFLTQLATQASRVGNVFLPTIDDEIFLLPQAVGKKACPPYHTEKLLKFVLSDAGQAFRHAHSVHEIARECNQLLESALFDDELIDLYKELSQYNTIACYPLACDAPIDVITKKQAVSAMDTLAQILLILGRVYENN